MKIKYSSIVDQHLRGGKKKNSVHLDQERSFKMMKALKLSIKSPSLSPPYPTFRWYLQKKEILLNLKMKCWNSAFDAQGSRLIIVVVQIGAVKIYVASSGGAHEKRKKGWNSVNHPNWWEK
jgi:hypothetical protein